MEIHWCVCLYVSVYVCSQQSLLTLKGNKIHLRHHNSQLCKEVKLLFRMNSALPPQLPPSFKLPTRQAVNTFTNGVEMAHVLNALLI